MKGSSLRVVILFALFFVCGFSWGNDIVLIKDLVKDADQAVWTGKNDRSLPLDQDNVGYGSVRRGIKVGGENGSFDRRSNKFSYNKSVYADTIDIEFKPTLGQEDSEVRGSYVVNLPDLPTIQLELTCDLYLDIFGVRSPGEFSIEVFEKDPLTSGKWNLKKTGRREEPTPVNAKIFSIEEELFTNIPFTVKLHEFAGKTVKIDLVSKVPKKAVTHQKGRWVIARLMGSTFRFVFDEPEVALDRSYSKGKLSRDFRQSVNNAVLTIATDTIDSPQYIYPSGITQAEGLGVVNIGGYWYGYFNCPDAGTAGTVAYQLANNTFYNATTSYIEGRVLRGTSIDNAVAGTSGAPFNILPPNPLLPWCSTYVGMGTGIVADIAPNDTRVHGFFHAERIFHRDVFNIPDGVNFKIGYARSSDDHGYNFSMMHDSSSSDATPIISSYQPDPTDPLVYLGFYGNAGPTAIKIGDTYYIFYTRNFARKATGEEFDYDGPENNIVYGTKATSICIAAASETLVCSNNYTGNTNPWKKFYNGSFSTDGRGGYDTSIIGSNNAGRGYACVTHSTFYDIFFSIAMDDPGYAFYLYCSDNDYNPTKWGEGIRLMEGSLTSGCAQNERTNKLIAYPTLVGNTGSSSTGGHYFKLFYAEDNSNPCVMGGQMHVRRGLSFLQ